MNEKKPIYKKWWFWVIVVVVIVGIGGSKAGTGRSSESAVSTDASSDTASSNAEASQPTEPEQEVAITYTTYDIGTMLNELESNALKAADTYTDQYVQISGKLSAIDSAGAYISIANPNDEWGFQTIHCTVTDDSQKSVIASLNSGDVITVKGKITDVGDILGYYLAIDEIIK